MPIMQTYVIGFDEPAPLLYCRGYDLTAPARLGQPA
jgi:hypothetical protein